MQNNIRIPSCDIPNTISIPSAMRKPRLNAILSFVEGAKTLADIGTDHGFLPIAACMLNKNMRAFACDANPGPLARAVENIKLYGLEDRIDTLLGYGLEPLLDKRNCIYDCVVIAGMGGMNIVEILRSSSDAFRLDGFQLQKKIKKLIIQPQRDVQLVRETMFDLGFEITDEVTAEDRGHSYTIIVSKVYTNKCNHVKTSASSAIFNETGGVCHDHTMDYR